MDELDIKSRVPQQGIRITCRRIKPTTQTQIPSPIDIGAATRPYPGLKMNGDAFVIKTWSSGVLVALIDGLGHGEYAHRAAQKARFYIERHIEKPLEDIFQAVGRECRSTRGVVMALARFDYSESNAPLLMECPAAGPVRLTLASIGNIDVRLHQNPDDSRLFSRRGIVGKNASKPLVTRQNWHPGAMLVLHSDGLSSKWKWDQFEFLVDQSAAFMARRMVNKLAKEYDDATAIVVKWRSAVHGKNI
jgi:serine/threonine protein phosphatase PrpC